MSKVGVLLLNMGGPDSLEAVKPFLYNLFSDPYIASFGIMQKPMAWLISFLRADKVKKAYERIGGKSPLKEITIDQAVCLENALGSGFKVLAGMSYWYPFIEDGVDEFKNSHIKKVVVLSLYPQFCTATTLSAVERFKKLANGIFEFKIIDSWCDYSFFIDVWIQQIEKSFEKYGSDAFVLFSAHGIPYSLYKKGDPYISEVERTVRAIVSKMRLKQWKICYQSRTGPVQWVKPSTEETIEALAKNGIKKTLVVPVSFVSDHIETLYEIDIVYKEKANILGLDLYRVPSLNTLPEFIEVLKNLVLDSL
ncbi:MAG TPA: ferrochelatase [Thermodesulfovibrio thiophilus]|nr:ferrochelatase [Thermodesulfovibrio thiophilus]